MKGSSILSYLRGLLECHKDRRGLVLLLALSFILKIAVFSAIDVVNVDGVVYINAAQEFAKGNWEDGLSFYRMPFYPLLIAGVQPIVSDWVQAGQIISLFSLVVAVIPLYLITERVFGSKAAFWAGLAFCVSPMINGYAADVYRDPIFLMFFSWSVYFGVLSLTSHRLVYFFSFAVFLAFSFFCRVEAVVLPFSFIVALAIVFLVNNNERRGILVGFSFFCGIYFSLVFFLLLFSGPDIFSYIRAGDIYNKIVSVFDFESYHTIYVQLKEMERTVPNWGRHSHNFVEITRHYLWLIYFVGSFQIIFKLLFFIFSIPLFYSFSEVRPIDREKGFLIFLFIFFFLGCYHFHIQNNFMEKRYLLPAAFLLFPWVGVGYDKFLKKVLRSSWKKTIIFILLIFWILPIYQYTDQIKEKDNTVKVAGNWMKNQDFEKDKIVISSGRRAVFYGGMGRDFIPYNADLSSIEDSANEKNADLIVIEARDYHKIPDFKKFCILKEFHGRKDSVFVFERRS